MKSKIYNNIVHDYRKMEQKLDNYFLKERYDDAVNLIEFMADTLYSNNITFSAPKLEKILKEIAHIKYNNKDVKWSKNENKIIFYDYMAMDTRGVARIYLRALMEMGYEILYITYVGKISNRHTESELQAYEKAEIYKITARDPLEVSSRIINKAKVFGASKILVHTHPKDAKGILALYAMEGNIQRYMVNITDHAFWLGSAAIDHSIEFRSYGYSVSNNYRKIPEEKLMILPYYPVTFNMKTEFGGFDFPYEGKKLILSGGTLYKIKGSKKYYEIIKYIIDNYDDTIFLYVGNGDNSEFMSFIKKNSYENRVFYSKERDDFNEIFKRCYFYLSTYPINGGLMTLYAAINSKIPLTLYNKKSSLLTDSTGLFARNPGQSFSSDSLKKICRIIDILFADKVLKVELEDKLCKSVITPDEFRRELSNGLITGNTMFTACEFPVNRELIRKIYINKQNYRNYCLRFAEYEDIKVKKCLPLTWLKGLFYNFKGYK